MGRWRRSVGWVCLGLLVAAGTPAFSAEKVQPFTGMTLPGETFDLRDYLGRVPILLDFGSIYCSSCVQSLPRLVNLQNRHGADKLRVVGINLDTYNVARVRRFYGQFKDMLSFPVVLDLNLKISRAFQVTTLPTYVLVDRNGEIVQTVVGYNEGRWNELEEAVRRVVEEGATAGQTGAATENVVLLTPDNFTKSYTFTKANSQFY